VTGRLATLSALDAAIVETVAYADVFAWPLTAAEVHRFLPVPAGAADVATALSSARLSQFLTPAAEFHVLHGREHLVAERRRRTIASRRMWPGVLRRARLLARIPWVRMVAVSGSLAVSAAFDGDDVDLFMVTDDERLWTCRALTILAGRVPSMPGTARPRLCPNFIVAVSTLELEDRDVYTAHELVQLVPLVGAQTYAELLDRNRWYRDFLPNHAGYTAAIAQRAGCTRPPGAVAKSIERWEMRRKVARLRGIGPSAETRFDASTCKGHVDGHRQRFWTAFEARLQQLEERAA